MIRNKEYPVTQSSLTDTSAPRESRLSVPNCVMWVGIVLLFAPVLWEAAFLWWNDATYAQGIFILPLSTALIWMERDHIRYAKIKPEAVGLVPLVFGLLLETAGYLLRIKFLATLALIPVLTGAILVCYGKEIWQYVRFSIYFLFFAAPIPGVILNLPSNWIQQASSTGAAVLMKAIGYPLIQTGNILEIPGIQLEVADVCSGFKKLTAFLAFATLYGYVFSVSPTRRVVLLLAAVPIAVLANVIRVSVLIAVASAGGLKALHIAHDWAEVFVLALAVVIFALLGKVLGCKTPRFSL